MNQDNTTIEEPIVAYEGAKEFTEAERQEILRRAANVDFDKLYSLEEAREIRNEILSKLERRRTC
ncbi:hypothetical protein SAMN05444369_11315 [Capnocytophaga haemolytica]|uniref:Uncharacterized protein n=1 Tax=Capnocytophaga haemolytica TaxID=45243 RepID=A0AAX2GXY1_9FLAO|nr:hypothetical protein [Capnocytophaga haemolytica]AMD84709.1 hypothetical protein AXF12_03705 [Capnocytophaga haemolytica]SFO20488.1 hypothetical protein SAMN05444369_11315 [Capnocytophaga haemolytica]SNV08218.1 Uncharacterised protein [Capnocytophaga haemolytica]